VRLQPTLAALVVQYTFIPHEKINQVIEWLAAAVRAAVPQVRQLSEVRS